MQVQSSIYKACNHLRNELVDPDRARQTKKTI